MKRRVSTNPIRLVTVKVRRQLLKAHRVAEGVRRKPKAAHLTKIEMYSVVPSQARCGKFYNDIWWAERANANRVDPKLGAKFVIEKYSALFGAPRPRLNYMLLRRRVGYYFLRIDYEDWLRTKNAKDWWEGEHRFIQNMCAAESLNSMDFTDSPRCILEANLKTWEEIIGNVAPKISEKIKGDKIENGGTESMVTKRKVQSKTKKKATGARRPVGRTLGLGVQPTWCYLFFENSCRKSAQRTHRTDAEISQFMKDEFRDRNSAVFDRVSGMRAKYNSGEFHKGIVPAYCPVINPDGTKVRKDREVKQKETAQTQSKPVVKRKTAMRSNKPKTATIAPVVAPPVVKPKMVRRRSNPVV